MKRILITAILFLIVLPLGFGQTKRVKNVILMIPDGTSLATVSSARWYQRYLDPSVPKLFLDPHLCGTVLTYSSNAPIGDSAPTTSCYMTGYLSQSGFVSTYPPQSPGDIFPVDPSMAYQPLMTVLEASRIFNKMATGLVVTCEFPHATPADCSAHSYNRDKYDWIIPQMIHNQLDVVIAGGVRFLNEENKNYLLKKGYDVYLDDINGFRSSNNNKMWSLFGRDNMPYDLDRDPDLYPSLAEMTASAIQKLSTNENGFFLMVEGSKIDWAAHGNDPAAMITEMLAFDKAFGIAVEFAKYNGETVVIAAPDHGNSGISIGSERCPGYSQLPPDKLFKNVSQYRATAGTIVERMQQSEPENLKTVFREYTGIELNDSLLNLILTSSDYKKSSLTPEERMKGTNVKKIIGKILTDHTCFGFTTDGHTGEEVFLAIYAPDNNRVTGHITNIELNHYMRDLLSVSNLEQHTADYFAKHTEVFKDYKWKIVENNGKVCLEVEKDKKNKLLITANSNIVLLNGKKEIALNSVVIYVDKNNTFYLPRTGIADYGL